MLIGHALIAPARTSRPGPPPRSPLYEVPPPSPSRPALAQAGPSRDGMMLQLVSECLPLRRRLLHMGEVVYRAGEPFTQLFLLNAGYVKIVHNTDDGRCQVVGLNFRGDWLGFDGIATGRYGSDAVALDVGEVWALRYDALLLACAGHPPLLAGLHAEMSRAIGRGRESMLSLCTLPVAARVAEFLSAWAEALAMPGQHGDIVTLRMTRADIGNYLGMTLESVSRAMSALAREKLIRFTGIGRRAILIPDPQALSDFIHRDAGCSARPDK